MSSKEQQNPYSLVFGREPGEMISRTAQMMTVLREFGTEKPSQQVYMITGVRGSGKTVLMTEIVRRLALDEEWVVAELNPERDMLTMLAARLSSEDALARIFQQASINLSFFGLGPEVHGSVPITDIELALGKMIASLQKHGKRLLIAIDEAANTKEMRIFANAFQILLRQDLPVYLLMTGLYEHIDALQNERTLTFLYRAPKLDLKPLNIGTIAANYRKNFRIGDQDALTMAKKTKGYSFAFQVLGYFSWEYGPDSESCLAEYKQYLEEYVYEKIWADMSGQDRRLAYGIAAAKSGKISEIRAVLNMDNDHFSPYRRRLIRKGLINGEEHGYVRFTLPMFEQFVLENYEE